MAGIISHFYLFIAFFHVCLSETSLDRRFSNLKRCADVECSMLLCRGKAARDFSGPDCRFLSFKKGETIYVYYKLSGQRSDMWAGSVGSYFGYFPKDFLNINHIYTEEEIEVPAAETDFVCFDTGQDKFESYNIDLLLNSSLLLNKSDEQNEEREEMATNKNAGITAKDVETFLDESLIDTDAMNFKDSEPLYKESKDVQADYTEDVNDLEPAGPQLPLETAASDTKDKMSLIKDTAESQEQSVQGADLEETLTKDIADELLPKDAGVLQKSDPVTQVEAMPELKTTLGTTFDAVVSDNEDTWKVTPSYNEEESNKLVDQPSEQLEEGQKEPALLSLADPAESKGEDISFQPTAALQIEATKATKDMWSSLGDTVFKIVSGGERTDLPDDNDDEEEEEEEEDEEDTETDKTENKALQVQDSETTEETDEIKDSNSDFGKEDSITSNATQYIEMPEQDSKILKYDNEAEEIESNDKSELSENTLDLDKTESENNEKSELSENTLYLEETENENNEKSELSKKNINLDKAEIENNEKSELSENTLDLDKTKSENDEKSELSENRLDLDETENENNEKSELSKKNINLDKAEIENNEKSELSENTLDLHETENENNEKSELSKKNINLDKAEVENNEKSELSENTLDLDETENENNEKSELSKKNINLDKAEVENNEKSELSENTLNFDETENENEKSELSKKNINLDNAEIESNEKSEFSENTLDLDETENENKKSELSKKSLHLDNAEIENNDKYRLSENTLDLDEIENERNEKSELLKNNLDLNEREIENKEKSELSKKTLEMDEVPADAESELDTQPYNLEDKKPMLDKPVTEEAVTNNMELHKPEDLSKAHARNSPQFDAKRDEQIDRVENDDHLFEDTLKTESKPEPEDDLDAYEENEDIDELLEDENALYSTKTEFTNEVEESMENSKVETELEDTKLAHPKQPAVPQKTNESTQKQTSEHMNASVVTSLDMSVPAYDEEADTQSTEVDDADKIKQDTTPSEEPEYRDSVLRLTLLRDHFKDDDMERLQRYLDLKDLFKIEAMFTELDQKLRSTLESDSETGDDREKKLESIFEASDTTILDNIEIMLDARKQKAQDRGQQISLNMSDDEAAILDDFQEFIFYLYQKHSAVSDSVPLVEEGHAHSEMENLLASEEEEDAAKNIHISEVTETPKVHEQSNKISSVNVQEDNNYSQDMSLEEDGGHFNKNKDIQLDFKEREEIQRGPQAILENPVDVAFGFEMEPSSGSLGSPRASDFCDNNANYDQASASISERLWELVVLGFGFLGLYSETLIAALPEEWQPGPTFHGLPWKPVVVTAIVGILTALMLIWRTVLAVKSRTYLLTEKQLSERIRQLVREKSDVLLEITELNNTIKQHEEKLKDSEKSQSSMQEQYEDLKVHYEELSRQREELSVTISHLGQKISDTQEEKKTLNEKVIIMRQRIEKYQNTLKLYDEERSKVQVLMDEAKLREDALKAQVFSFEKDNSALKEQKKSLLRDANNWQEKHDKLSEEIRVYHKTRKDLEDSLVHKENEIDVLSSCIAELKGFEVCDAVELQKGDAKLANGETGDKKGDPIKLRLKQMMDVSRIKTTLSVIEDERNHYLENFLAEQKARQELEGQFQKVVHDQTNLKNEKTHLESQYKNLQQRLEITTELYQQKENALQQKLTQEELERREKETKLSEVDGRALQAEEELSSLRQKVKDMQEEMQQNERTLKAEIAVQEKKAHENWLKARTSERALIEERRESANLRQKIVECSDKMADLEHALYKSGPSDRHINPLRIGDSYGPSPVSGGAPSPPLMIEAPGRPPSAPVGRRNEPFGPRSTPDTGRFSDLGHPLQPRPEMFAPRTSSPCAQDSTFQLSKSQNQGLFLPSPIRDSPGPASNPPSKAYGSQHIAGPLPPPSNGPLPPMSRPPNGHPPIISSGPPDARFRPPHTDSYGSPPLRPFGPIAPAFARGLPLRELPPMGPPPPPFGMHDFPPDFTRPRDLPFPRLPFAPGSLPPPGAMVPPPFGSRELRGPVPLMSHPPRGNEDIIQATGHATEGPSQQGAAQDTTTSVVAEP
ncbi:transport and Golgi organization protein 1 homolog isoform X2 [Electrophorus electricus]|nr:transport and Golgi organization protein 1 homolog isoform X2 [Electrophorus electricus]